MLCRLLAGTLVLAFAGVAVPAEVAVPVDVHYSASIPFFLDRPPSNPGPTLDEYMWDDGASDNALGLTAGGAMGWWHCFEVIAGNETVSQVASTFGYPACTSPPCVAPGTPFSVGVWSDPNNDCNPGDGALLAHAASPDGVVDPDTDFFNRVAVPATNVGNAGDRFFVVTWLAHPQGKYPAPMDSSAPQLTRAWWNGEVGGTHNPTHPPTALGFRDLVASYPYNWMERGSAGSQCPNIVPCEELKKFKVRCKKKDKPGVFKVVVKRRRVWPSPQEANVLIAVNGEEYCLPFKGKKAKLKERRTGEQYVEMLDPPDCFDPVIVDCGS